MLDPCGNTWAAIIHSTLCGTMNSVCVREMVVNITCFISIYVSNEQKKEYVEYTCLPLVINDILFEIHRRTCRKKKVLPIY